VLLAVLTNAVADASNAHVSFGSSVPTMLTGQTYDSLSAGGRSQASKAVIEWTQPNWSERNLSPPSSAPWPYTILFVGVNSDEKFDLSLKTELQRMESASDTHFNSRAKNDKPILAPIPYSTWDEVMHQVGRQYPTILHFGCHAEGSGLELFKQTVQPQQMILAINAHNEFAREKGEGEIRLIAVNACNSDQHAENLSACVDFVIGHNAPVSDRKAILFTDHLYSNIFKGMHLANSFNIARSVSSNGYQLYAKKDPRKFCLLGVNESDEGQCSKRKGGGEGGKYQEAKKQRFNSSSEGASVGGQIAGRASLGGDTSTVVGPELNPVRGVFQYDVYISHTWGKDDAGRDNHARAKHLNASLRSLGFTTWFDDEQMQGNIHSEMARGIEGSVVILICVTQHYMKMVADNADSNCKFEFGYAMRKRTTLNMMPIVMEESMANTSMWRGSLGMTLGRHQCRKLTTDDDVDFNDVVKDIAVTIGRTIEPQKLLTNELQGAAHVMSSRSPSPAPSAASGMDTVPASPQSPSEQEVHAMHIDSEVSRFKEDMRKSYDMSRFPLTGRIFYERKSRRYRPNCLSWTRPN